MMQNNSWANLDNLVLVAAHAVYVGENLDNPNNDNNWFLQKFQRGEPPYYIEHILKAVDFSADTEDGKKSLLIFSGGQTRYEAGPKSEAQSCWMIADHFHWWRRTEVKPRATTEEFARDSFENLLFGICRFHECTGKYPIKIFVFSWEFKEKRFDLHREAIRFPPSDFHFVGVNQPEDIVEAEKGEARACSEFRNDLYGCGKSLNQKRADRNPFSRHYGYALSCPELKDLLHHCGPQIYNGNLPWRKQ